MFCLSSKRWLLIILSLMVVVLGLAYYFQWQIILAYAPFLFILACPLMHLFHGHGGHGHEEEKKDHHHH